MLVAVTLAALTIVRIPRRVELPTAASNSIFPVPAVSIRFWLPLTAALKAIAPTPLPVSIATAPVNVVADTNLTLSFVVVISASV